MNRYITTTLPYVNGDPHIGFAQEIVQADTLARLWRASGDSVFFTTGTDEHGQKIFEAAEKNGEDVHAYIDRYAAEFRKLKDTLALSNDAFVRTTDAHHKQAAQEMWKRCDAAGDIYEKTYTGLYCVGCEAFKTEHELTEDGHCELHPSIKPQELSEKNYFFALSKYQDMLIDYLQRPRVVIPEWRREEALEFVKKGLEDISISREKERLTWGVPVPGDDSQVMYVWFDALTSYISVLGWPEDAEGYFDTFWNKAQTLQVAGKDQVRFQSILWQAMLFSAGIKNTDAVFYHGFINSGGQRMSKSLGNVISPYDLVAKYGTDATRYMILRHLHPVDDSDVTWERLDEWYTANLVNGLGNLVARVMKLAEDNLESLIEANSELDQEFIARISEYRFNDALDFIFEMIAECDVTMTERAPFKKVKSEDQALAAEGKEDIRLLVRHLVRIASHLSIAMPSTAAQIIAAIAANKKPENLFPRLP